MKAGGCVVGGLGCGPHSTDRQSVQWRAADLHASPITREDAVMHACVRTSCMHACAQKAARALTHGGSRRLHGGHSNGRLRTQGDRTELRELRRGPDTVVRATRPGRRFAREAPEAVEGP